MHLENLCLNVYNVLHSYKLRDTRTQTGKMEVILVLSMMRKSKRNLRYWLTNRGVLLGQPVFKILLNCTCIVILLLFLNCIHKS